MSAALPVAACAWGLIAGGWFNHMIATREWRKAAEGWRAAAEKWERAAKEARR